MMTNVWGEYTHELASYDIRLPIVEKGDKTYVQTRHGEKILVPPSLRGQVLIESHDENGHPGERRTKHIVYNTYWWPDWTEYVRSYVRSCHACQVVKPLNKPRPGLLQPIETPAVPNKIWAIDTIIIGSDARNTAAKYVQLIVDHHSRYVWASATKTNTAAAAIGVLRKAIAEMGKPEKLIVDNARNFRSNRFRNFASTNGIRISYISTYHPQANGLCERTNETIIRHLILHLIDNPSIRWPAALGSTIRTYNSLTHTATGFAPESLHFGRNLPRERNIDDIRAEATTRSKRHQENRKERYDEHRISSDFLPGQKVLVKVPENHPHNTKLNGAWDGPFIVIAKIDERSINWSESEQKSTVRMCTLLFFLLMHRNCVTISSARGNAF